jgi:hypothetical protein
VGEVAQRLVLDRVAVAVGAAKEVAGVGFAVVLAHNLGNMHGGFWVPHPGIIGGKIDGCKAGRIILLATIGKSKPP